MTSPRHRWMATASMRGFEPVERCQNCGTERVRDGATKTLFLYRGGAATPPGGNPLRDDRWTAFKAKFVPHCTPREEP